MKKLGLFLSLLICVLLLAGCGKEKDSEGEKKEDVDNSTSLILSDAYEKEFVVYVDPGHGFEDPGCSSSLLKGTEAKNTLEIAKILKEKLEEAGAKVILTHDGLSFPDADQIRALAQKHNIRYSDEYVKNNYIYSASERAVYMEAMCLESDVDFFVSLHINSLEEEYSATSRYELFFCQQNLYASELSAMCTRLERKLDKSTWTCAMDKGDAYAVIRNTPAPCMLVEMGYCTNERDAKDLNSDAWREKFCDILAEEIMTWDKEE